MTDDNEIYPKVLQNNIISSLDLKVARVGAVQRFSESLLQLCAAL